MRAGSHYSKVATYDDFKLANIKNLNTYIGTIRNTHPSQFSHLR